MLENVHAVGGAQQDLAILPPYPECQRLKVVVISDTLIGSQSHRCDAVDHQSGGRGLGDRSVFNCHARRCN
jgi:hypothetical protein